MNEKQTIIKIMSELFGVSEGEIAIDSGIGDFPKWDSLGHINLLQEIQDELDIEFEVEFEPEEIIELETVEDIINLTVKKENVK